MVIEVIKDYRGRRGHLVEAKEAQARQVHKGLEAFEAHRVRKVATDSPVNWVQEASQAPREVKVCPVELAQKVYLARKELKVNPVQLDYRVLRAREASLV